MVSSSLFSSNQVSIAARLKRQAFHSVEQKFGNLLLWRGVCESPLNDHFASKLVSQNEGEHLVERVMSTHLCTILLQFSLAGLMHQRTHKRTIFFERHPNQSLSESAACRGCIRALWVQPLCLQCGCPSWRPWESS